jgi:GMP synthase (glutamine-hydrolysing)
MTPTALVLTHDDDTFRGERMLGTLRDTLHIAGYECVTRSLVAGDALLDLADVAMVVPLGSEAAAYDDTLPWLAAELAYLRDAIEMDVPVFGICFGAQLLARALGGEVVASDVPELGFIHIESDFAELLPEGPWVSSHYDVIRPPASARVIARTALAVQAFVQGPHLGVQFHPEVTSEVLRAWQGRRLAGLEPGDAQLDTWLDLDSVADQLDKSYESTLALCQKIVDSFVTGEFASLGEQRRTPGAAQYY